MMCRLFGCVSAEPRFPAHFILDAENSMLVQSQCDLESRKPNDAGWGYGIWDEQPEVIKHPSKPCEDELFRTLPARPFRRMMLHIRRASAGGVSTHNTHPFRFEDKLIFAHNGTIDKFESVRDKAVSRLPANLRNRLLGETDSEFLMYLFLDYLLRIDTPETETIESFRSALSATISAAEQLACEAGAGKPPELNFIFLTKHFLIATKILYWLGFYDTRRNSVIITSEPAEPGDGWIPLNDREMIVIRRDASYERLQLNTH